MKILAVECADKAASCAIAEDGKIICESFISAGLTHSRTLMPMIDSMLKNSETDLSEIDRFAVTVGPGSFTGLRIGIAAIKGMAFGLEKECCGISTLYAAALSLKGRRGIICAVLDARCHQVYNALFLSDGEKYTRLCDDRALMCDKLASELEQLKKKYPDEPIILVGGGAKLCYNEFGQKLGAMTAPEHISVQRAGEVALAAFDCATIPAQQLLPSYLRLPQAERELKEKRAAEHAKP